MKKKLTICNNKSMFTNVFKKNKAALKSNKRFIVNQGGSSSSKTYSILQLLLILSIKYSLQIDIVGLSVPHLKTGVLNDMPAICRDFGIDFDKHFNKSDKILKIGKGVINFLSFDNLGKAHGGRRDILYMNEANHLDYNIVQQLMMRTRQKIFIDFNPTSEFWAHEKLVKDRSAQTEFIVSTYKDNHFLEQSIIDDLEIKKGNNNFWRVYGLGEIGISEGLVFQNFEEKEFDKTIFDYFHNGIDWGFSNDPFAFVRCAIHHNDLYIIDEIYQRGLLNKDSAPLVRNLIGNDIVYCDSAEPKSVSEYQSFGLKALSAKKGQGSVESGIKFLQSFNKIYIHKNCPNILAEFKNYQWIFDKNGNQINKPIDNFNHAIDALRYSLSHKISFKTSKSLKHIKI